MFRARLFHQRQPMTCVCVCLVVCITLERRIISSKPTPTFHIPPSCNRPFLGLHRPAYSPRNPKTLPNNVPKNITFHRTNTTGSFQNFATFTIPDTNLNATTWPTVSLRLTNLFSILWNGVVATTRLRYTTMLVISWCTLVQNVPCPNGNVVGMSSPC